VNLEEYEEAYLFLYNNNLTLKIIRKEFGREYNKDLLLTGSSMKKIYNLMLKDFNEEK